MVSYLQNMKTYRYPTSHHNIIHHRHTDIQNYNKQTNKKKLNMFIKEGVHQMTSMSLLKVPSVEIDLICSGMLFHVLGW